MRFAVLSLLFLFGVLSFTQAAPPCQVVVARGHHAPAYAAHHGYQHHNFVPVVQAVQVIPDFFYSSRDYARDDALLEAIRAMREQLNAKSFPVAKASSAPRGVSVGSDLVVDFPGLDEEPAAPPNTMVALLKAECQRCHDSKSPARMNLTDPAKLTPKQLAQVQIKIALDQMPPARPLGDAQKKVVEQFVAQQLQ